jgi:hypothetical protein
MRLGRISLYGLAVIGGVYLLIVIFFSLFSGSVSTQLRSATSPDHQWAAELVLEQPKSSSTQHISLWLYRIDSPGRKFGAVLSDASTTDIQLTWRNNKQLEVTYPPLLALINDPPSLDKVEILYTARPTSNIPVERDASPPSGLRPSP